MRYSILFYLSWICVLPFMAQSPDQNYVLTKTYTQSDGSAALTQILYYDGLGRPIQTVQQGISGESSADLITFTEYDGFGREHIQWLPIVNAGNGAFVPKAAFTGANTTKTTCYQGDSYPYNELLYEPSSLNRLVGHYGAGADWRSGQGHKESLSYEGNQANEVALFLIAENEGLSRNGYYSPNTLYKTVTLDEDNEKTVEFKDMLGRVVILNSPFLQLCITMSVAGWYRPVGITGWVATITISFSIALPVMYYATGTYTNRRISPQLLPRSTVLHTMRPSGW